MNSPILGALFDWLISRVNETTAARRADGSNDVKRTIGLLDIFGFEVMTD